MKRIILVFITMVIASSSCTLTEHIHFNDDYSGNVKYTIDYSWYTSLIDMDDSSDTKDYGIDSILQESMAAGNFDSFEGITNMTYMNDSANKLLVITYDFANLHALNNFSGNSQNIENTLTGATAREFAANGKKLIFKSPKIINDSISKDLEEFSEYYKYTLVLSFEREIKKVNNTNAIISEDKKDVTLEGDLFKLFSEDIATDMIINLK